MPGAEADLPALPWDLTDDALLGGRLRLLQPARGFRAGQDSLLLAAAVPAAPGESALDLGCGAGAAVLALGARVPGLALAGLEVQAPYAALARANAARNGMQVEVVEGDVADSPRGLRGRAFDHVLSNPPYFDRAASSRAPDPGRDLAQGGPAPLSAWIALAARRLREGGTLTLILPVARLPAALAALPASLGSPEALPLPPWDGAAPDLMVLRARKGGRAPFRLLPPLALRDGAGPSAPVRAALAEGAALPWPA